MLTPTWARFCLTPSGDDVQIQLASDKPMEPMEKNCHFHAGVEYVENLSDSGARLFSNARV